MTTQPELGIRRELSLGDVISKTFELYRRDFTKYFVIFAVVGAIIGIVTALAAGLRPPDSALKPDASAGL